MFGFRRKRRIAKAIDMIHRTSNGVKMSDLRAFIKPEDLIEFVQRVVELNSNGVIKIEYVRYENGVEVERQNSLRKFSRGKEIENVDVIYTPLKRDGV